MCTVSQLQRGGLVVINPAFQINILSIFLDQGVAVSPKERKEMYLTEAQKQRHEMLVHGKMERIEFKYLKAKKAGVDAPAIVVFDLEDGEVVSFLKLCRDDIDQHVAYALSQGFVPTTVWHGPSAVAARRFDHSRSERQDLLAGDIKEGFFPVIICGAGSTSMKLLEIPIE